MGPLLALWFSFAGLFRLAAVLRRSAVTAGSGRAGAGILLLVSPIPWAASDGVAMGLVAWLFCALPVAAVLATVALTFRPRLGAALSGAAIDRVVHRLAG